MPRCASLRARFAARSAQRMIFSMVHITHASAIISPFFYYFRFSPPFLRHCLIAAFSYFRFFMPHTHRCHAWRLLLFYFIADATIIVPICGKRRMIVCLRAFAPLSPLPLTRPFFIFRCCRRFRWLAPPPYAATLSRQPPLMPAAAALRYAIAID